MRRAPVLLALSALLFAIAASPPIYATEEGPQRTVINQGGEKIPVYVLGGLFYRELAPADAAQVKADIPVAFTVKLREVEEQDVFVYGAEFDAIRLRLVPGLKLPAAATGTNLVLGAVRLPGDEEVLRFEIRAAALLPDDLTLLAAREKALAAKATASPEEHYALGDWIETARVQSQIIDEVVFRRYEEARDRLYREALRRDEAALAADPGGAAKRIERAQLYLTSLGAAPTGHAAALLLPVYRDYLTYDAAATRAVEDGKALSAPQVRALTAYALLQLGEIHRTLFHDEDARRRLLLAAAQKDARIAPLAKPMRELGYVLYEGAWLTAVEAAEAKRKALAAATPAPAPVTPVPVEQPKPAASTAQDTPAAADRAEAEAEVLERERKELTAGAGVEDARLTADALVGAAKGAGLAELRGELGTLPVDIALDALFQAAAWQRGDPVDALLAAALSDKRPRVRREAIDLLAASGTNEAIDRIANHLLEESDAPTRAHAVETLWQVPGAAGITGMIAILSRSALAEETRRLAARRLAEESGQDLALDAGAWKRWWAERQAGYRRKTQASTGK